MNLKSFLRNIAPERAVNFYHLFLALAGAVIFWFPSRKITVIGVTGTSGKSTTVDFITKILEEDGNKVASISSIRFKIGGNEWKNGLKMTMPGRFAVQKFLGQAVNEKCNYAVLEVTSEGIRQSRHKFINFDTAVFTNLGKEHIESHGSFENYRNEKLKLFRATQNMHVVNIDDPNSNYFLEIPSKKIITFGLKKGDINKINSPFYLKLPGDFNVYNALSAIAVAKSKGISLETCKKALEKITGVPGRMEIISQDPFLVVVDYAHTPDQLEKVYKTFSQRSSGSKIICVLGSCGGGRDKWKRFFIGKTAKEYCNQIIITNEDPYDENPMDIINQVAEGAGPNALKILDRKEAIKKALKSAEKGDAVIITGKGSESLMCLEGGKKIPWDDRQVVRDFLLSNDVKP